MRDESFYIDKPVTREDAGGAGRHLTTVALMVKFDHPTNPGHVQHSYAYRWSMDARWTIHCADFHYRHFDTQAEAEAELIRRYQAGYPAGVTA